VTTVSEFFETGDTKGARLDGPIEVITNFFAPRAPQRSREEIRHELGFAQRVMVLHSSNLRPLKRIDLLLER